jgi:hypothetical protein
VRAQEVEARFRVDPQMADLVGAVPAEGIQSLAAQRVAGLLAVFQKVG